MRLAAKYIPGVMLMAMLTIPNISEAQSKAERWLIREAIKDGCDGAGGKFTSGVYRVDLDGDGKRDLMVDHDGLVCRGASYRSFNCGVQVCSTDIYLRRGGLLKRVTSYLGTVTNITDGKRPVIVFTNHGGSKGRLLWTGTKFKTF